LVQTGDRSGGLDEARAQQIDLAAPVHLPLDELELGDLPLSLPIRPRLAII